MAEAGNDAVERERSDLGFLVLDQHEAGFRRSDLGNGGRHHPRQGVAAGDRRLHLVWRGGDHVDEIGVDEQGRTPEHHGGDVGLVGRERMHDRRRRLVARRERFRHGAAHQRRGIVEQHQHRALGGRAIIGGKIRVKVSARERAGGVRPHAGRGGTVPLQELPNDHAFRPTSVWI